MFPLAKKKSLFGGRKKEFRKERFISDDKSVLISLVIGARVVSRIGTLLSSCYKEAEVGQETWARKKLPRVIEVGHPLTFQALE